MSQDVYADILFLINFSMDYLCLYICAKAMHLPVKLHKMLISASLGGIYSVLSLFLEFSAIANLIIDAMVCLILCIIVFADRDRSLSSTLLYTFLFIGISMMMGGCMTAVFNLLNRLSLPLDTIEADSLSTYLFAILAVIAGFISLRSGELLSKRSSIKECTLKLSINGKECSLLALSDSGNLVKDPLSGKAVTIVDRNELCKIIDTDVFDRFLQGKDLLDSSLKLHLRLIPINTAGGRSTLVACRPEKTVIEIYDRHQKKKLYEVDTLIAPSDIKNSANGYKAIIPAEILKQY